MAFKKNKTAGTKIPVLAVFVLMLIVGGAIFAWNTINKKLDKPMNGFFLPLAMALLGFGALFVKPLRGAAVPVLLGAGAVAGAEVGRRAGSGNLLGAPVSRYRVGQNRPYAGTDRPYAGTDRPALALNAPRATPFEARGGSQAWANAVGGM